MENKIYGYVYLITNLINGKQYVGQTTRTIKRRFFEHCYNAKNNRCLTMPITKAIKKYREENFKIEEIGIAYTYENLNLLEGLYISLFETLSPGGYNLIEISQGKRKHSEKTKEKMRTITRTDNRRSISSIQGKKRRGIVVKNSKSKYCGVSTYQDKYRSVIRVNNKKINIGSYNNEIDAAKAYDIEAIKYFGKNAILNFPELRRDYINEKITIKKNSSIDRSKTGIKGIYFHNHSKRWCFKFPDKILKKRVVKYFKTLEEAISYKESTYSIP